MAATSTPPLVDASAPVLDKIIQVAQRKLTGAVEVHAKVGRAPRQITVYMDNGLIYAITSPQYAPPARQWSERALGEPIPEGTQEDPEEVAWRIASAREANGGVGIPAEQIDRVRKDRAYGLLAAALTWSRPSIKVRKRATTANRKFDPASWQRLVSDLASRQSAYQRSWAAVCQALVDHDIPPADADKAAERLSVHLNGSSTFTNASASLDQIAYETGQSRAGIVTELARQLAVGYAPQFSRVEPSGQILTPEALEDPEHGFALAPEGLTPRQRQAPIAPVAPVSAGPVRPIMTAASDMVGPRGLAPLPAPVSADPQDDDDDLGDQYEPHTSPVPIPAPIPAGPLPDASIAEIAARAAGRHAQAPVPDAADNQFFTFTPAVPVEREPEHDAEPAPSGDLPTLADAFNAADDPAEAATGGHDLPALAPMSQDIPAVYQEYTPPMPLPVTDDLPTFDGLPAMDAFEAFETAPVVAAPQEPAFAHVSDEEDGLPTLTMPPYETPDLDPGPRRVPDEQEFTGFELAPPTWPPLDSALEAAPLVQAEQWTAVGPTPAAEVPTPAPAPAPVPAPVVAPVWPPAVDQTPAEREPEPTYEPAPAIIPLDPRQGVDSRSGAVLSRWADSVSSFLDAETQVFILDRLRNAAIEEVSALEQLVNDTKDAQGIANGRLQEIEDALSANRATLARIEADLNDARAAHTEAVAAHEAKRRYALEIREALTEAQREVATEEAALDDLLAQVARAQVRTEAARAAVRSTGEQIQVVDQELESVTGPAVQAAALNADAFERDNYLPALRTVQAVSAQMDEARERLEAAERAHREATERAERARRLVETLRSAI